MNFNLLYRKRLWYNWLRNISLATFHSSDSSAMPRLPRQGAVSMGGPPAYDADYLYYVEGGFYLNARAQVSKINLFR